VKPKPEVGVAEAASTGIARRVNKRPDSAINPEVGVGCCEIGFAKKFAKKSRGPAEYLALEDWI
jgi:hypothetical protein